MGRTAGFDHVAFPVADVERTVEFYRRLGLEIDDAAYRAGRSRILSIRVGTAAKINIHPPGLGDTVALRAPNYMPGTADVCFVWEGTFDECLAMLAAAGVTPESEPMEGGGARTGVPSRRIYARDPDGNLLEWMTYVE